MAQGVFKGGGRAGGREAPPLRFGSEITRLPEVHNRLMYRGRKDLAR